MYKEWTAILTGVCILLTACGRGGGEKSTVSIADPVKAYETISYQEYKEQTGKEAEFYHATRFMGEIPDSSICVIFEGTYDEETAGTVLADDAVPIRLQGPLGALMNGIGETMSLAELAARKVPHGWKCCSFLRKENRGMKNICHEKSDGLQGMSISSSLCCRHQNPDTCFDSQISGVHVQIIVFRVAPFLGGECIVKILSSFIVLFHGVFCLRLLNALPFYSALKPLLVVGIDKDMQAVCSFLQNITGGPSHDYAVSFRGSLFDDAFFFQKKLIREGKIFVPGKSAKRCFRKVHQDIAGTAFLQRFNVIKRYFKRLCRLQQDITVIKLISQRFRQLFSNLMASAGITPFDGNDIIHKCVPLSAKCVYLVLLYTMF